MLREARYHIAHTSTSSEEIFFFFFDFLDSIPICSLLTFRKDLRTSRVRLINNQKERFGSFYLNVDMKVKGSSLQLRGPMHVESKVT